MQNCSTRFAALVPPPRVHRRRYYGVLAPNAPLRAAGTPEDAPHSAAARYLWAMLLARIYEVLAPAATLNADEAGISLH
jgi:Putative transposase